MKRGHGTASEVGIPKMALPKLEPSQPMTTRCKLQRQRSKQRLSRLDLK